MRKHKYNVMFVILVTLDCIRRMPVCTYAIRSASLVTDCGDVCQMTESLFRCPC